MNERIEQLIDKATVKWSEMGMQQEYFDKEKFAELIVRECADIAADMSAIDIYEEIREHFGVEQ